MFDPMRVNQKAIGPLGQAGNFEFAGNLGD
jgi:hypothetical protein